MTMVGGNLYPEDCSIQTKGRDWWGVYHVIPIEALFIGRREAQYLGWMMRVEWGRDVRNRLADDPEMPLI
ncbi:hypothetical protein TNIN_95501 [Trichonephila inaurata madagascariensis]|uniref:Uncharacterized protein n=1 Tax=Trichonephila inaurata madagascariensis TaxID=2747483 RepID=A0A8X6MEQ5_9ARAC|nr:hypothetical protein TNIN_95501 [Trichonephila inaurata madagascariensis]